jgi:hypothetical protein
MIHPNHILALSQPGFVNGQLRTVFCAGACDQRRKSFWRGWAFERRI